MNKETTELLNQLAIKLGTTIEHLWEILIRQAFISGIIDIFQYICIGVASYYFIKYHYKISKNNKMDEGYDNGGVFVMMLTIGAILGIISIVAFFSIHDTITGFINPEYWALDKILDKIK